jgi:hypothetical protein
MKSVVAEHRSLFIASLTLVSWLGMAVHNAVELPDMPFYRPEYLFPSLVSQLLIVGWWRQPSKRKMWAWSLFGWAGIHLIAGAVLSIIPLPIWPFVPGQTPGHYLSHAIYGAAQLPLMIILWKEEIRK